MWSCDLNLPAPLRGLWESMGISHMNTAMSPQNGEWTQCNKHTMDVTKNVERKVTVFIFFWCRHSMTIKPLNKYIHKKWYGSQCETRRSTYHTITPVLYRNALKESDKTRTFSHHTPQARNLLQRSAVDSGLGTGRRMLPGPLIHDIGVVTLKDTKINAESILQVTGSSRQTHETTGYDHVSGPLIQSGHGRWIWQTFSSGTGSESGQGEMKRRQLDFLLSPDETQRTPC